MAVDFASLWNFQDPALSEERFQSALAEATGDDVLVLQTQIARTYGLRREFDRARQILGGIESEVSTAGAEAQARYWLELGRSYSSATHPPESQTEEAKAHARTAYGRALDAARAGGLDGLAVDVIHMMAFIDTAPADQLKWAEEALKVVDASNQPAAKKWEASIRHNIGYALHQLGRLSEALAQFEQALVLRERGADQRSIRVARWMIAWTLRGLGRTDEALDIQHRLEHECEAAHDPDVYVFEELEHLYRLRGDGVRAEHYASLRAGASGQG
jgi:tetratricopeptide (TPR) repeat protein